MLKQLRQLAQKRQLLTLNLSAQFLLVTGMLVLFFASALVISYVQLIPASFNNVYRVVKAELSHYNQADYYQLPDPDQFTLIESITLYRQGKKMSTYSLGNSGHTPLILNEYHSLPPKRHQIYHIPETDLQLLVVGDATLTGEVFRYTLILYALLVALGFLVMSYVASSLDRLLNAQTRELIRVTDAVTKDENFKLRARKIADDDSGELAGKLNDMLGRMDNREQQLRTERDRAEKAQIQAQHLARETREANKKLEFEVQVRTKMERKITEFQKFLGAIIDSMPSALITVDEHLYITQWNREASKLSGTAFEAALGYRINEAFPLLENYVDTISQAFLDKDTHRVENVRYFLDGQELLLELIIYPLNLRDQIGAVIRVDDVSERQRLNELVVQSEKMLSVGGLAAGMAHEINNPLSAITQNTQTMQRRLFEPQRINKDAATTLGLEWPTLQKYLQARDIPRFIGHIQEAAARATQIVTDMLQFSRRSDTERVIVNLQELIQRTVAIANSNLDFKDATEDGRITLEIDLPEKVIEIPAMSTEIEQVLLNLIKNAAQAIAERQKQTPNHPGKLSISLIRNSHNEAEISITDNGSGMDEDTRKRVFEPFFTTKDVGEGTGLGMSVSYFIIHTHHHGRITVSSRVNSGSTFSIFLPLY